jgi:lactate dehydrogenase-like 2-hydroxyacid dehydrogenase
VSLAACLADAPGLVLSFAMDSFVVLMLHPMDEYLEQELGRRCRLLRLWDAPPDRRDDFLRAHAGSVRAVVTGGGSGAGAKLIDALPGLEIIASCSVGVDLVDLARCRERGVRVTNTPGVLTDDVADFAVGLAIAALRRVPQADRYVRAGQWKEKGYYPLTAKVSSSSVESLLSLHVNSLVKIVISICHANLA